MTRIFRAAGLAAACAALSATATIAAPSLPAQNPAAATAAQSQDAGFFSGLFKSAVAAFEGTRPAAAAPSAPAPTLAELVDRFETDVAADPDQDCLATAIYFESRGEPIEGQLAVANVVMNRAASGHYPTDLCDVITQHAQFSFVRHGVMPMANRASEAWRKAVAIAHIAEDRLTQAAVSSSVLWYHATYVAPSWGKRLTREGQIGLHIFYS